MIETENPMDRCPVDCDIILRRTQEFVTELLLTKLAPGFCFHNIIHTQTVVDATDRIARAEQNTDNDRKLLLIAAWFHDTGYTQTYLNHEVESINIATSFLRNQQFPEEKITRVNQCIAATRMGVTAQSDAEKILQDADLFHLSQDDYFSTLNLLREELEVLLCKAFDDQQWLSKNADFLRHHQYKTKYGQEVLEPNKLRNLARNEKLLK